MSLWQVPKRTEQKKFKWRLSEKKLLFCPIFSVFFLNTNNNDFAMPEVGTIEIYIEGPYQI